MLTTHLRQLARAPQKLPPRRLAAFARVPGELQRPGRAAMVNAVKIGEVVMRPAPELGDTLLVDGRPAVVMSLLPGRHRHEVTARYAYDLPCGRCGTPLSYSGVHRSWRCDGCRASYGHGALAKLARAHG